MNFKNFWCQKQKLDFWFHFPTNFWTHPCIWQPCSWSSLKSRGGTSVGVQVIRKSYLCHWQPIQEKQFKSWSNLWLIHWESSKSWPKCLGSCSHGGQPRSSRLLAWSWLEPDSGHCSHLRSELHEWEIMSGSLFLAPSLSVMILFLK